MLQKTRKLKWPQINKLYINMSLLNSVTALKTFSNTSSLGNTCSTPKAVEGSSIFTQNKISKNDDNKKNLSEEEIMQKATSYSQNFIKKYDCSKLRSKVENIEKSMRFSKNAELCSVPTNLKSSIKTIGDEIQTEINNFSSSVSSCKTEDEIKTLAKELENKLQQKKHQANIYTQRAQKAQQLDNKLMSIATDPKKVQILDSIDMSKIVQKLTEPVENVDISENTNNIQEKDNQDNKINKASFEEALKNDEISNVITSLIKYADGKEKDEVLDNYLKKNESQNNTANTQNQTTFNADFLKSKKNPFLQ